VWRAHANPAFWTQVGEITHHTPRRKPLHFLRHDLFRNEGVAVGQISGAGLLARPASASGGLTAPGFPLSAFAPVCQTAIYTGCSSASANAAKEFERLPAVHAKASSNRCSPVPSPVADCHLAAK